MAAAAISAALISGSRRLADIVPHRERAQADLVVGVRLAEMAPVVPHDVPIDALLFDVIDQQRLREVLAVERRLGRSFRGPGRAPRSKSGAGWRAACRSRSPSCRTPAITA